MENPGPFKTVSTNGSETLNSCRDISTTDIVYNGSFKLSLPLASPSYNSAPTKIMILA